MDNYITGYHVCFSCLWGGTTKANKWIKSSLIFRISLYIDIDTGESFKWSTVQERPVESDSGYSAFSFAALSFLIDLLDSIWYIHV